MGVRGRKKGVPNKLTTKTREELWTYCQAKGVNPFEFAVDVIAGDYPDADMRDKLDCAKDLRGYLLPRLKQVDATIQAPEALERIARILGMSDDHA